MIRFATETDVSAMKALWAMSFDDPVNFIDFFYDKIAKPSNTLVYEADDKVVAMATLLPTTFRFRDKSVLAMYFYGIATHKQYRGKGIASELLSYCEEYSRSLGYTLAVLVPGQRYLFDFYKRRGYWSDFNCHVATLKHGMLKRGLSADVPVEFDTLSPGKLFDIRESALTDIAHISWNEQQLVNILLDAQLYGEHTAHYEGALGRACAIYGMQRKQLFVKECLGTSVDAQQLLLSSVIEKTNPSRVTVQLPLHSELFMFESETRLFGMAKPLTGGTNIRDLDAYMNLMLD